LRFCVPTPACKPTASELQLARWNLAAMHPIVITQLVAVERSAIALKVPRRRRWWRRRRRVPAIAIAR
jgi:hypothetical protein